MVSKGRRFSCIKTSRSAWMQLAQSYQLHGVSVCVCVIKLLLLPGLGCSASQLHLPDSLMHFSSRDVVLHLGCGDCTPKSQVNCQDDSSRFELLGKAQGLVRACGKGVGEQCSQLQPRVRAPRRVYRELNHPHRERL